MGGTRAVVLAGLVLLATVVCAEGRFKDADVIRQDTSSISAKLRAKLMSIVKTYVDNSAYNETVKTVKSGTTMCRKGTDSTTPACEKMYWNIKKGNGKMCGRMTDGIQSSLDDLFAFGITPGSFLPPAEPPLPTSCKGFNVTQAMIDLQMTRDEIVSKGCNVNKKVLDQVQSIESAMNLSVAQLLGDATAFVQIPESHAQPATTSQVINTALKAEAAATAKVAPGAAVPVSDENVEVETPTLSPQALAELVQDNPKNATVVNMTKNVTVVTKNETADDTEAPMSPYLPIQASVSNAFGARNVTFEEADANLIADGNLNTGFKFSASYLPAVFEFTLLKEEVVTNVAIATYDDLAVPENCIIEKWTGTEWEKITEAKYANRGSNTMKISGLNVLGKLFRVRFEAITLRQNDLQVGLREVTFQSGGEVAPVNTKTVNPTTGCKFSVGDKVFNRYAGGPVWAFAEVKSVRPGCTYKVKYLEDVLDDAVVKECMIKTNRLACGDLDCDAIEGGMSSSYIREGDNFTDGNTITYKCSPGYTFKAGDATRTCVAGIWAGDIINCAMSDRVSANTTTFSSNLTALHLNAAHNMSNNVKDSTVSGLKGAGRQLGAGVAKGLGALPDAVNITIRTVGGVQVLVFFPHGANKPGSYPVNANCSAPQLSPCCPPEGCDNAEFGCSAGSNGGYCPPACCHGQRAFFKPKVNNTNNTNNTNMTRENNTLVRKVNPASVNKTNGVSYKKRAPVEDESNKWFDQAVAVATEEEVEPMPVANRTAAQLLQEDVRTLVTSFASKVQGVVAEQFKDLLMQTSCAGMNFSSSDINNFLGQGPTDQRNDDFMKAIDSTFTDSFATLGSEDVSNMIPESFLDLTPGGEHYVKPDTDDGTQIMCQHAENKIAIIVKEMCRAKIMKSYIPWTQLKESLQANTMEDAASIDESYREIESLQREQADQLYKTQYLNAQLENQKKFVASGVHSAFLEEAALPPHLQEAALPPRLRNPDPAPPPPTGGSGTVTPVRLHDADGHIAVGEPASTKDGPVIVTRQQQPAAEPAAPPPPTGGKGTVAPGSNPAPPPSTGGKGTVAPGSKRMVAKQPLSTQQLASLKLESEMKEAVLQVEIDAALNRLDVAQEIKRETVEVKAEQKLEEDCKIQDVNAAGKESAVFEALMSNKGIGGLDWKTAVGGKQHCFETLLYDINQEQLHVQGVALAKLRTAKSSLTPFGLNMSFAAIENLRYQQKRMFDAEDAVFASYQQQYNKSSMVTRALIKSEQKRAVLAVVRQGKLADRGMLEESKVQDAIGKQASKLCTEKVAKNAGVCERLISFTKDYIQSKTLRIKRARHMADRALQELALERDSSDESEAGLFALNVSNIKLLGARDFNRKMATIFAKQVAAVKADTPLDCKASLIGEELRVYHFDKRAEKTWLVMEGKHMHLSEEAKEVARVEASKMSVPVEAVNKLPFEGKVNMTIGMVRTRESNIVDEAERQRTFYATDSDTKFDNLETTTVNDKSVHLEMTERRILKLKEMQHARALELLAKGNALNGKFSDPAHVKVVAEVRKEAQDQLASSESN